MSDGPAPVRHASSSSVGVKAPGMQGTFRSLHTRITPRSSAGLTTNRAPAATTSRAEPSSNTVPAPTRLWGASELRRAIASSAPGVVSVTSMTLTPPVAKALAAALRSAVSSSRTTAMTPPDVRRSIMRERGLDAVPLEDGHPARRRFDELRDARRLAQRFEGRPGERQVRSRGEREGRRSTSGDQRHYADPEFLLLIGRADAPLVV